MTEPTFYLGTHHPHWLGQVDVPLFISRRRLEVRKTFPRALGPWVLDSGGFTELSQPPHRWSITTAAYAASVRRWRDEIGNLAWCAPMDWMCEPSIRAKTGLSVADHQARTIDAFGELRSVLGPLAVPAVEGWEVGDYTDHLEAYWVAGIDLEAEPVVAIGSICRRGQDAAVCRVVRTLHAVGLRGLHAFGVRGPALLSLTDVLASADSMAWSYRARRSMALPGCRHQNCANCQRYALAWRAQTIEAMGQLRIEERKAS